MAVRLSSLTLSIGAVLILGLAGCDGTKDAVAKPAAAAPVAPDPAAPAPGSQAAEAIGADSSAGAAILPPEKQHP